MLVSNGECDLDGNKPANSKCLAKKIIINLLKLVPKARLDLFKPQRAEDELELEQHTETHFQIITLSLFTL